MIPGVNEINREQGPKIFDVLDRQLREDIERRHGVRKSALGSVDGRFGYSGHVDMEKPHGW